MSAFDRKAANLKTLAEADSVQEKTKDAIARIQRQTAETEELAATTLEELRKQGAQMDDVSNQLDSVSNSLDKSQALQNKFDSWAGNWLGGKKREALKEASAENTLRRKQGKDAETEVVTEVYEHEKFESLGRKWKPAGIYLCSNPTVSALHIFDPSLQGSVTRSHWIVDYTVGNLDAEGWTYAPDFSYLNARGFGDAAVKWNSYVRRRKWKFSDTGAKKAENAVLAGVRERKDARDQELNAAKASLTGASTLPHNTPGDKQRLPFVPRSSQAASPLVASGLTVKGRRKDEAPLDEDSAEGLASLRMKDAEIDAGIAAISNSIDRIGRIAGHMKEETTTQTSKLETLDNKMQTAADRQAQVNARQRRLLQSS